jgi:hypothetical protein
MGKNNNGSSMWDDFDPNNMTDDQRDNLLGQVYGGYKQKVVGSEWETRGAGRDGTTKVKTGDVYGTDYDAYENDPAWNSIATNLGITGAIDNQQELGVMANYVAQYGQGGSEDVVAPEPEAEDVPVDNSYKLSNRAAEASAGTKAYEDVLLNKQGTATIGRDSGPEQDFKNAYQDKLTEEMKVKDPTTLATTKAKYELADRQGAKVADSFNLGLGSSPTNKGLQFT